MNKRGRIEIHGGGIGEISDADMQRRAAEIARMDGRAEPGEQDRLRAREELVQPGTPPRPRGGRKHNAYTILEQRTRLSETPRRAYRPGGRGKSGRATRQRGTRRGGSRSASFSQQRATSAARIVRVAAAAKTTRPWHVYDAIDFPICASDDSVAPNDGPLA